MADTASYYHAAYIVAAILYVAYGASLIVRRRQVRARLAALQRSESR
ncbi:MAG TPA: hypothetical protein VGG84_08050 [Gemmatimonadaceae bacterium]|jgi:hypothetical protein